jgi:Ca-activated chloride channel family protein
MRLKRSIFGLFSAVLLLALLAQGAYLCASAAASVSALQATSLTSPAALAPAEAVKLRVIVVIEAPSIAPSQKRLPVAVSLVLDRSGSMSEARKMSYAKVAAKVLVDSLAPDDMLGLVAYDEAVRVLAPVAPVTDKERLTKLIDSLNPGGTTFLSGGLEQGIKQLNSFRREGPSRVILLSDGLANKGVTDPELVAGIGAKSKNTGVAVSTLGLGLDFNEDLMQLLAQRGGGRYYYIKDSEFLPSVIREELAHIAGSFTDNLRVTITWTPGVSGVEVIGYETSKKDNQLDVGMGDFTAGEKRQIALEFAVSPKIAAGRQKLGELSLAYKNNDAGIEQEVSLPIEVEVLADADARGRLEKTNAAAVAKVNEEFLLLEAEAAHVRALEELERGRVDEARKLLREQQGFLAAAPESKVAANKLAKLKQDEAQLDEARGNAEMQKSMAKSGKASFYGSASGSKQGIMLQKGDKGFQVERLQTALKKAGFYKGAVDGVYAQEVVDAVKELQKTKGIDVDGIAGPTTLRALGID